MKMNRDITRMIYTHTHDRVKRVREPRQGFERRSVGVAVGQPVARRTNQLHRRVEAARWERAVRVAAQAVLR